VVARDTSIATEEDNSRQVEKAAQLTKVDLSSLRDRNGTIASLGHLSHSQRATNSPHGERRICHGLHRNCARVGSSGWILRVLSLQMEIIHPAARFKPRIRSRDRPNLSKLVIESESKIAQDRGISILLGSIYWMQSLEIFCIYFLSRSRNKRAESIRARYPPDIFD